MKVKTVLRTVAAMSAAALCGSLFIPFAAAADEEDSGSAVLWIVFAVAFVAAAALFAWKSLKPKTTEKNAPAAKNYSLQPTADYKTLDPKFDPQAFKQKVSNLYVRLQTALTLRDISELQPFCTEQFFDENQKQIEQWKASECIWHADRLAILNTAISGYRCEDGFDYFYVNLYIRAVNYTVSETNKKVLSGSKSTEKFQTIRVELVRPSGDVSLTELEAHITNCPNCGAPVNAGYSAKCTYCGCLADQNEHGFRISSVFAL